VSDFYQKVGALAGRVGLGRPHDRFRGGSGVRDKPAELLAYINGELLSGKGVQAASDTGFRDGWIDSLSILKLIAFIERMTRQEFR